MPGPRQTYVDAFGGGLDEEDDVFAPRTTTPHRSDPYASVTDWDTDADEKPLPETEEPEKGKGGKGRAFTGIAAAAVTTVLAVVVAGQVATGREDDAGQDTGVRAQSTAGGDRGALGASGAASPSVTPSAKTLTYDEKMGKKYALGATLEGSGSSTRSSGSTRRPARGRSSPIASTWNRGSVSTPRFSRRPCRKP